MDGQDLRDLQLSRVAGREESQGNDNCRRRAFSSKTVMAEEECEMSEEQKKEIAKWFLLNSPSGEIQYIAKDLKSVLNDDKVYDEATLEAFPLYNKSHLICLELPCRSGDVLITPYNELEENQFIEPRTAQVATIDHVKQACTEVRPAADEELPSLYIEEFRCALDGEMLKYVEEAYPKGVCSVFCVDGKDAEGPGCNFEFVVVISAARNSPKNFCNGSWRSVWNIKFKEDLQVLEIKGKLQVDAHYFEEGNVQLDTEQECKDGTIFQAPEDCAISIANIIRHHEGEYMGSLEASYSNLPDTTFKELRRKLPVTRTLFPWHNTLQFSLTKELGIGK
ncbi:F-actin-capping protein subunit alpha [Linum grandiflorum]